MPTRGESAFIGFKRSAAFGVLFWGVWWAYGYDGSWTALMLMVIAFIVFCTSLEVLLSNWYFKRLEERARKLPGLVGRDRIPARVESARRP